MTEAELFQEAYNLHERAEQAALNALVECLQGASLDALTCLCDPQWRWGTRSFLSDTVIEFADEVLNARLDALVAA